MSCGALILCGGRGERLGQPKASVPFGPETLLERTIRILGEAASPIVVVAADRQELPNLPCDVEVVRDRYPGRGPLEGLAAGLSALVGRATAAYVTGCDTPLLKPAFVRRVVGLLGKYDAAVPYIAARYHPLSAVYRTTVLPLVEQLLADGQRQLIALLKGVQRRVLTESDLSDVDQNFDSLRNVNYPTEYLAALAIAGTTTFSK
jgi:molybdopterin-guanine dinucleotide biosynthesis protein A